MSYVVIGYPKISEEDFSRVQNIREEYDLRQFDIVKPHVTFIFPTAKLDIDSLTNLVKNKVEGFKDIPVIFGSAKVIEDDSKTYFHTFLIPSSGFDEIEELHNAFYTGELESELRADIPFIPHLGIGNDASEQKMKDLAEQINASNVSIPGSISELTIAEFDGTKLVDMAQVPLS
jgi:2'-5' RNA ligase